LAFLRPYRVAQHLRIGNATPVKLTVQQKTEFLHRLDAAGKA
jgi:hypothetical protein